MKIGIMGGTGDYGRAKYAEEAVFLAALHVVKFPAGFTRFQLARYKELETK